MTTLAVRYETGTGRRFVRHESGKTRLDALRERIERDEYDVDPEKVADAMLRRLRQCS